MTLVTVTDRAVARLNQRGIRANDIDLALLLGTAVEGGIVVLQRDYQAFEREVKRLLQRARRLVGKRLVIDSGRLVTGYHAAPGKMRRLLRNKREGALR